MPRSILWRSPPALVIREVSAFKEVGLEQWLDPFHSDGLLLIFAAAAECMEVTIAFFRTNAVLVSHLSREITREMTLVDLVGLRA